MDSEQFDGLARRFGQARSRRQALHGLAGVGAMVLGASLGAERATAKRKGRGRVAAANHKSEHCAREGKKVGPGKSGKACCAGLAEDAEGRCQPQQLTECCVRQTRRRDIGPSNCPDCSVGDAVVTCEKPGTCTGFVPTYGSGLFQITSTFGTSCDPTVVGCESGSCCVQPNGDLTGCAIDDFTAQCFGSFRVPYGGLTCPSPCNGA